MPARRGTTVSRVWRQLWTSVAVFAVIALVASCGSRTGLLGPLPAAPDAAIDVTIEVVDARRACVPGTFPFTQARPELMFLLDRSESMRLELTSNDVAVSEPSRWEVLNSALSEAIVPFSDQLAMGARFFPDAVVGSSGREACTVDVASTAIPPAFGNAQTILDVFNSTFPAGSTPTAQALQQAVKELSSSRGITRVLVLATDGAPNCNPGLDRKTCTCTSSDPFVCSRQPLGELVCLDDIRTVEGIATLFGAQKIPVYVIGIGVVGSFANTLDAMAIAGGRPRAGSPRYYPGDTPTGLTDAFTSIRDSVAKCSYVTPSSPLDPDAIAVAVAGQAVSRDPSHVDGWDWIDQDYGQLQLFGPACALATASNVSGTVTCDQH